MENFKEFSLPVSQTAVGAVSLASHMTLRNACIDYRNARGASWVACELPEASAATSPSQIPCINKFNNIIGHMYQDEIICYKIRKANSLVALSLEIQDLTEPAFLSGRLWNLPGTVKYSKKGPNAGAWMEGANYVLEEDSKVLSLLSKSHGMPLSANITHAAMEANHFRDSVGYKDIYLYPHNAAISVGLIGQLHDNQCIDMSPNEMEKNPNLDARAYIDEFIGYICAGHTSHSGEAGRVRRVACDVSIRLLTRSNVEKFVSVCSSIEQDNGDHWILFCMGVYCYISNNELLVLCRRHRLLSLAGVTPFSIHIDSTNMTVVISISSGPLIKLTSNGYWADNVETYKSDKLSTSIKPIIALKGKDQLRACFSAFFVLFPYISSNRPPRPQFASVQTPQAICLPWCPGDAAVSPCYSFDPIVTTSVYNVVMDEMKEHDVSIASYLPGENPMCLYLNMEYNYEDAIIVSKRYIDNGGFSTSSLCSYNLPQTEYIPEVGSTLCGVLSPWWKSPCQRYCTHDPEKLKRRTGVVSNSVPIREYHPSGGNTYCTGYGPTGVVHSITRLNTGDVNIRIRSHQQLQPGDKLSMPHGQKGVAIIVPYEEMPIAIHPTHGKIIPDIIMAMSSVVTRQTNGALYEAARSLSAISQYETLPIVTESGDRCSVEDEFKVISGATGKPFYTLIYDDTGTIRRVTTRATAGFVRIFNQTQMSRERHQVSHVSPGKYSLRTPDGRRRGGGVAWGEMEVQASSAAGLQCCDEEITERGDKSVEPYCLKCQRRGLLCTCTTQEHHVLCKNPYDLLVLDVVSAIVYNGSFQYILTPETR